LKPVALTLAGAYHLAGEPLSQRRLVIEVLLPLSFLAAETAISARVTVEGIADDVPAEGVVRVSESPAEAHAELQFRGDDGAYYVLTVASAFAGRGIRALTELEGALTRVPGVWVGPIRLRLDWRSALFRGA